MFVLSKIVRQIIRTQVIQIQPKVLVKLTYFKKCKIYSLFGNLVSSMTESSKKNVRLKACVSTVCVDDDPAPTAH